MKSSFFDLFRKNDHRGRCGHRREIYSSSEQESDERAREGIFLAVQYPSEIPGVSIANFLRAALQARMAEGEEIDASAYYKRLYQKMDMLKIDRRFTSRSVNEGLSGQEQPEDRLSQRMVKLWASA